MGRFRVEGFFDDRGVIMFSSPKILSFDYKYLTIGTVNPNCSRGGHYHKRIFEKILCIEGELVLRLDNEEVKLNSGEVADIPVGVAHTIFNKGNSVAFFVEFKSEEFNPWDSDTFKK